MAGHLDRGPEPPASGDGFLVLADGTRRWGRYGAAGVLVRHRGDDGASYLVALRSAHCHQGGTWAIPGGALHRGEAPVDGARREFAEEVAPLPDDHQVVAVHEDDHGGWAYWTVLIDVARPFPVPAVLHWETAAVRWVTADELAELELFDPFRVTLGRMGLLPPAPLEGDER